MKSINKFLFVISVLSLFSCTGVDGDKLKISQETDTDITVHTENIARSSHRGCVLDNNPDNFSVSFNDGKIIIAGVFPSERHDSCMISIPGDFDYFEELEIIAKGDNAEHKLFLVITDLNGENHFIGQFPLTEKNTNFIFSAKPFLTAPLEGVKKAECWGGDGNQKIDWPVKKITIGINDIPDTFKGKFKAEIEKIIIKKQNINQKQEVQQWITR